MKQMVMEVQVPKESDNEGLNMSPCDPAIEDGLARAVAKAKLAVKSLRQKSKVRVDQNVEHEAYG